MVTVKCPSLPVTRKCCCCIPIRTGIIIFGYLNLVLSLLALPLLVFLTVSQFSDSPPLKHDSARLPVTLVLMVIDMIMSIVLLVGAHKRNRKVLKGYFWFGAIFQALTLFLDLATLQLEDYIDNLFYCFFLCLNIYLLFLVYNTIYIIEESNQVRYISQIN